MNYEHHQRVTASHLERLAYLYVRQSTLRQVFENTESTKRQYGLRERAVALGWSADSLAGGRSATMIPAIRAGVTQR